MNLVHIALSPSRGLMILMFTAHLLALLLVWSLIHPAWVSASVALLILFSLIYTCWRIFHPDVVELSVDVKHGLMIQVHSGERFAAIVSGDSLVTSFMSVLRMKIVGHRFSKSVLLLPDMLDEEQYRVLRVWLKWGLDSQ